MKANQFIAVLVRLFAIVLFLNALGQLSLFLEVAFFGTMQGMDASLSYTALHSIPWLIASIVLWKFPLTITKSIVSIDDKIDSINVSPSTLLQIGVALIGIYFLFKCTLDLIYWGMYWNVLKSSNEIYASGILSPENKAAMLVTFVEILLSILLIVKSKEISRFGAKF